MKKMSYFPSALTAMKLFLFDMDGTLHNGQQRITGTAECMKAIAELGARFCILTNNSSRSARECREVLAQLGCDIPEENIFTAAEIAAHYIATHWPESTVFVVGTQALEQTCHAYGLTVTNETPGRTPESVLVGLDQTLTYGKLAAACAHLRAGARYLATHPDVVCPVGNGEIIPDIGCTLTFIEAATGLKPLITGKPNPYVLSVIRERHAVPLHQIVMVGDRLTTDIALGVYGSIKTALVFSGVTSRTEYDRSPYKSAHVFSHIGELAHALQTSLEGRDHA